MDYGYAWHNIATTLQQNAQARNCHGILFLGQCKISKKMHHTLKKALLKKTNWVSESAKISKHKNKTSVPLIASWGNRVAIFHGTETILGDILHLDLNRRRHIFFLPSNCRETLRSLPNINLGRKQVTLCLAMADDLSRHQKQKLKEIKIQIPAKRTLKASRKACPPADEQKLSDLLTKKPWVWSPLLVALDVQIRLYFDAQIRLYFADVPPIVHNLVCPDEIQRASLLNVLQALTLTNDPGLCDCGPIVSPQIPDSFPTDHRLLVMYDVDRRSARRLSSVLQREDENLKRGAPLPLPRPTLPVLISASAFSLPFIRDIPLEPAAEALSIEELSTLRSAACHFLHKNVATRLSQEMGAKLNAPEAPFVSLANLWLDAILITISKIFRLDASTRSGGEEHLLRVHEEAEARDQKIAQAIMLLSDPQAYNGKIVDRPKTTDEATALQAQYPVFKYCPKKGDHAGETVALTNDLGLMKLIGWDNDSDLPILLDALKQRKLLLKCKENVSFQDKSLRLHWLSWDAIANRTGNQSPHVNFQSSQVPAEV